MNQFVSGHHLQGEIALAYSVLVSPLFLPLGGDNGDCYLCVLDHVGFSMAIWSRFGAIIAEVGKYMLRNEIHSYCRSSQCFNEVCGLSWIRSNPCLLQYDLVEYVVNPIPLVTKNYCSHQRLCYGICRKSASWFSSIFYEKHIKRILAIVGDKLVPVC